MAVPEEVQGCFFNMILTDGTFITWKQENFPFEQTPGADSVMKQQPKEDFVSYSAGSFPKIFEQEMSIMGSQQMLVHLADRKIMSKSHQNFPAGAKLD